MGSSIDSARKFDQTWETLNWSFKFSQFQTMPRCQNHSHTYLQSIDQFWFAGRAYSDNNMLNDEDNIGFSFLSKVFQTNYF
ncbi:unnamed protein product [Tenebrio molitor]|nr:unnamed protein product [Tenebrio molitor]